MAVPFTIMCFAWNAAGLRLCETMSQGKADDARKEFKAWITLKKPCLAPDFFEDIRGIIANRRPSIVVMVTEDEDYHDTYFHSELLPAAMPEIGYVFLKRDVFTGIGEEASGVPQVNVPTGEPSGSALRVSVYVLYELGAGFRAEEQLISKFFGNHGQIETKCQQGDRVAGAIAVYIWHETYGKFVFIATHLPSGAASLKVGKTLDYGQYRAVNRAANSLCLLKIMNQFVDSLPSETKPDHVFLLGDLNYDIFVPGKKNIEVISELAGNISAAKLKDLQKYDELKKTIDDVPLAGFKEGVAGEGPLFMPTWRLARGRPNTCVPDKTTTKVSTSCFEAPNDPLGGLGWHNRILHKEMMTSHYIVHCTNYNRIDVKNMHASTNAGVLAFFDVQPIL